MYLIYTVALGFGLLIVLPYYALRFHKYLPTLWERLGFVRRMAGDRPIWIHAVSVGELRAVDPLIRSLRKRRPAQPIVVSTTTTTGRALATGLNDVDQIAYFPLDLPNIVSRTLDRLRPEMVIMAETEIWPNFLRQCRHLDIPVFMVNGRISDRSFSRYRIARRWLGRVLDDYRILGMQSDGDADRIRAIGAPDHKVEVWGNLKYDGSESGDPLDDCVRRTLQNSRPLIVAASTARGEEQMVIDAFRRLTEAGSQAKLLIAPRRPEQFNEVCSALEAAGFQYCRRSSFSTVPRECDVFVLDTIGELSRIFEFASVVFMGGTLVSRGGHNILEPARYGKPVLFGPHMHNFRDMADEFLDRGAAIEVPTSAALAERIGAVLDDPGLAGSMTAAAREILKQNAGGTDRALGAILESMQGDPQTSPPVIG